MPMWRIVANSLVIAVASTVLQLITGSMAAYGFARLDFRGKNVAFGLYLATLMVPMQVLVVPLFIEMKTFNLQDTYFALLAPSLASAFGVFLLKQAVQSVPRELDEAATIDGASHLRIFTTIVLPLVRPALATVAVFAFMSSWNSFLWPLVVIRSPELMTLPLGLSTLQGQFTTQWDVVMAGSVVSIVPIALVYLLAQRHIIAGVAHTGLK
jgi:multiple sugar transport system permease protein